MNRLFLIVIILFSSCKKNCEVKISDVAMGIPYKVIVKDSNLSKNNLSLVQAMIENTFDDINNTINHWNKNSEISSWNRSKSLAPIKTSPLLLDIMNIAHNAYKLSCGKFDPSIGKATRLWKQSLKLGCLLTNEEIETLKLSCGLDKIIIGKDSIQKKHPDLEIDLDGITKGYFCDILAKKFSDIGLKNFLVEWGGEIKIVGGPFKILVEDRILTLSDTSIATSGPSFQLYPIKDSKTIYSHFIDPKTLRPIAIKNFKKSVSKTSVSCAIADALATSDYVKIN